MVIGRAVGTVSSSGPSIRRSTLRPASSGSSRSTGSSSPISPWEATASVGAAVMGLVIEAIRKIIAPAPSDPVRIPPGQGQDGCVRLQPRVSASTPVTSRGLQPPCHTPLTSAQTSPFGYAHPAELPHPITAPHGGSRARRQWVTPGWTSSTRAG